MGSGNDFLDLRGGTITGTVSGEVDDDVYYIDQTTATLSEAYDHGLDTVKTWVSYMLSDHFEALSQVRFDVVFDFGFGDTLTVANTTIADLANDLLI